MKIAVTGATGQLGRLVVNNLLEHGSSNKIIAVVRDAGKARSLADRGRTSEDCRIGIDYDVVLDRRMTFFTPADRPVGTEGRLSTEGDSLVDLDVVPDSAGLSDDDAGTMIDEELSADLCTWMNLDPGQGAHQL